VSHDHGHGDNRRRLLIAIVIVVVVLVVEVIGAAISDSLALLADAGHMFSDLTGLVVAFVALAVAARPATDRQTFGYRRVEVFAALVNSLILIGVALAVTVEAIGRLTDVERAEVQAPAMLVVAAIGLAANIAAVLLLRPAAAGSINMRGAYLEVLGDALGSLAAVAAAVVILTTGFAPADAIASLLIAVMIGPRAFLLLRDVIRVLSQATPPGMDPDEIRRHIRGIDGVIGVHDVHVWAITSGAHVFSAHVVVEPAVFAEQRTGVILDQLAECLADHFDVEHSTFQLEPREHADHEDRPHH